MTMSSMAMAVRGQTTSRHFNLAMARRACRAIRAQRSQRSLLTPHRFTSCPLWHSCFVAMVKAVSAHSSCGSSEYHTYASFVYFRYWQTFAVVHCIFPTEIVAEILRHAWFGELIFRLPGSPSLRTQLGSVRWPFFVTACLVSSTWRAVMLELASRGAFWDQTHQSTADRLDALDDKGKPHLSALRLLAPLCQELNLVADYTVHSKDLWQVFSEQTLSSLKTLSFTWLNGDRMVVPYRGLALVDRSRTAIGVNQCSVTTLKISVVSSELGQQVKIKQWDAIMPFLKMLPELRELRLDMHIPLECLYILPKLEHLVLKVCGVSASAAGSIEEWEIPDALEGGFFAALVEDRPLRITIETGELLPRGWQDAETACRKHGVTLERRQGYASP